MQRSQKNMSAVPPARKRTCALRKGSVRAAVLRPARQQRLNGASLLVFRQPTAESNTTPTL